MKQQCKITNLYSYLAFMKIQFNLSANTCVQQCGVSLYTIKTSHMTQVQIYINKLKCF